jgi:uncharacterized protein involved in exopolysaccharide biosynthesis
MTLANNIGGGLAGTWQDRRSGPGRTLRREDRAILMRYFRQCMISVLMAWALAFAYLVFTPVKYMSRWTLILPGSAQSQTMQLDTIGQATSTANSPFGSVSLSPKVVYREIADSDLVRIAASEATGMTYQEFGRPRIKLIDETGLMQFELGGPTPQIAQKKALASITALNRQLEILRKDELEKRAAATTLNLQSYKDAVDAARQKITDIQLSSGLVSVNQFNESVGNLALTRRRLTELAGELDRVKQEQASLVERIGISPANANLALRMAADPTLLKTVGDYADSNALYVADAKRFGPDNPVLIASEKKRAAALEQLRALIAKFAPDQQSEGHALALMGNLSHQAERLAQMLRNEAIIEGKSREIETLKSEKAGLEDEITRLSSAAAQLEDLKKNQILAEAVYASAVARVDTSKSDIYGAYPIVQVLAPPNLPEGHEQPRRLYAFAGGIAGTLFSIIAWGLAWLHYQQSTKRRKKNSSTG